jgi:hypothetical protein
VRSKIPVVHLCKLPSEETVHMLVSSLETLDGYRQNLLLEVHINVCGKA